MQTVLLGDETAIEVSKSMMMMPLFHIRKNCNKSTIRYLRNFVNKGLDFLKFKYIFIIIFKIFDNSRNLTTYFHRDYTF